MTEVRTIIQGTYATLKPERQWGPFGRKICAVKDENRKREERWKREEKLPTTICRVTYCRYVSDLSRF